jgi:hypothetical protein
VACAGSAAGVLVIAFERIYGSYFCVAASSGIASLLLPGGHTAHSTFCITVHGLCQDSWCQIDKKSKQADMLCNVRLIIWDEAVTQHRYGTSVTFTIRATHGSSTSCYLVDAFHDHIDRPMVGHLTFHVKLPQSLYSS